VDFLKEIKKIAKKCDSTVFVEPVLENPKFKTHSGCSHSWGHHYGDGGLCKHTYEVLKLSMSAAKLYNLSSEEKRVLCTAAIWHDYGKIWDYESVEVSAGPFGSGITDLKWTGTPHRHFIRHLSRSAIEWEKFASELVSRPNFGIVDREKYIHEVTHAILSHHGEQTDFPPKTAVAWILHLSDNTSARVTDALNGRWNFEQKFE
jgi:hypothetical protein